MSELIFDVHTLIAAVLLLGWLVVQLVTEYLFRVEHQPRTWVHRACFAVYRRACWLSRSLNRWHAPAWLVDLPYTLLPLPLCRIGFEIGYEAERDTPRAAPPSGAGVMAACGHADTHPAQAVIGAAEPLPAKPVLTLKAAALPGAARSLRARPPASSGRPDSEGLL